MDNGKDSIDIRPDAPQCFREKKISRKKKEERWQIEIQWKKIGGQWQINSKVQIF